MKKVLVICAAFVLAVTACKKENKPYLGVPQVALENTTYAYKITKDTTVIIPVQLVSPSAQGAISVGLAADSSAFGTLVQQTAFPAKFTIESGRFTTPVSINVSYAGFGTAKTKALRLKLSCDTKKVADNYNTTVLTFTKQ